MSKNFRPGGREPAGQDAEPPFETRALTKSLKQFINTSIETEGVELKGRGEEELPKTIGTCKFGVYAFFDYDGEPIYVGQTAERLSARIGRHLTGQRSDPVAKGILDPYEVRTIRVWPMPEGQNIRRDKDKEAYASMKDRLDRLEGAVYRDLEHKATHGGLLNEIPPKYANEPSKILSDYAEHEGCVVNDEILKLRSHVDSRIARRAMTLSKLSQNISEREASRGLRHSLYVQARRLVWLAKERWDFINGGD